MPQRILLVEDGRTQAFRMQQELLHYGLIIETAGTGTSGLAAARMRHPDVIVLDVDLPEMDGYTVCRMLKDDPATCHIPVILLTHHYRAVDALTGLESGAIDFIPKDIFVEHNLVMILYQLGMI